MYSLEYFLSLFTNDNNGMPDFDVHVNDFVQGFSFSVSGVKSIGMLKSHSTPGPDNFLKKVRTHIASPLTKPFNISLNEGCVPSD